jgi:hypothetical protein
MNANHLERLTKALATLKAAHDQIDAVGGELHQAYDDQPGAWRWTPEADAAGLELDDLDDVAMELASAITTLRNYLYTFGAAPDFASMLGQRVAYAPLPAVLPTRAEIEAMPGRPGAAPYPFIKRITADEGGDQ